MAGVRKKSKVKIYQIINLVLVIGMLISLFLLYEHFSSSENEFCKFGEGFDCGVVNKSPYANLDGLSYLLTIDFGWPLPFVNISGINFVFDFLTSNAFLGFLTLLFLLLLLKANKENKDFLWIKKDFTRSWARGISAFGVLYGIYLFYIQHSILQTYCLFCLLLDATLLTLLVLVWSIKK